MSGIPFQPKKRAFWGLERHVSDANGHEQDGEKRWVNDPPDGSYRAPLDGVLSAHPRV